PPRANGPSTADVTVANGVMNGIGSARHIPPMNNPTKTPDDQAFDDAWVAIMEELLFLSKSPASAPGYVHEAYARLVTDDRAGRELRGQELHAKTIVTDATRAYVGSVNFSKHPITQARELGLLFDDAAVIGTMTRAFEAHWQAAV